MIQKVTQPASTASDPGDPQASACLIQHKETKIGNLRACERRVELIDSSFFLSRVENVVLFDRTFVASQLLASTNSYYNPATAPRLIAIPPATILASTSHKIRLL